MLEPTLLTIILNYKTAEMTLRSAEAALSAMEGIVGEIVIVDNDSQDGSFETMSSEVAAREWDKDNRVRVVQSGHNGGFGAGNNFGIRAGLSDGSRPDFIYVLNSDAFPRECAIRALLDHMRAHPGSGIAGSFIHGLDGVRHTTAFRFPSIASEFEGAIRFGPVSRLLKSWRVPMEYVDETQAVDWLAGASLMMRRKVLDEIGLFDEKFFLYFEETDLCRRAAHADHRIDFVRQSEVTHIGSVSTGMGRWDRVPDYWFDSRLHYFIKNHGKGYAALATLCHLAGGSLHALRCLLTGKERGVARGFLTSLAKHDLRVLSREIFKAGQQEAHSSPPQL